MSKILVTYHLKITLLDDIHTGSGLGTELINSLQARDGKGYPVLWRQHLKGLLKQKRLELEELAPNNKYTTHFQKLLADNGQDDCILIPGSCFMDPQQKEVTMLWSNTARESSRSISLDEVSLNRAPKAKSLRTQEYIKAGTTFNSTWYLCVNEDKYQEYQEAFEILLQRVSHLGANKNRGSGQILLNKDVTITKLENTSQDNADIDTLDITLTNLEPLRLPNTDIPGNIIPTNTHLSGSQLAAAFANWCRLQNNRDLFEAFITKKFTVSYAYPMHPEKCEPSVPAPLNLQTEKASCNKVELPWWSQNLAQKQYIDGYSNDPNKKAKRLKGSNYITIDEQAHTLFSQPVAIHMRNSVRTNFDDGSVDDSKLFSEEIIPEHTQFHFTITAEDNKQLQALHKLLEQSPLPLLLGRGKAPCEINPNAYSKQANRALTFDSEKTLTLVLASPLLCYNPQTVEAYTQLNHDVLNTLFEGLALSSEDCHSFSEPTKLTGFSHETGLPKQPIPCIAAGSSIHIRHPEKATELVKKLSQCLALGEKQHDGLGQYWWYQGELEITNLQAKSPAFKPNKQETLLKQLCALITHTNNYPSVTQWQRLKHQFKHAKLTATQTVEDIFIYPTTQQRLQKIGWKEGTIPIEKLIEFSQNDPDRAILCCDFIISKLRNASQGGDQNEQ
ncbi:RAMP superfamily CRISPR-associated protein [Pseudoalteromonas sp. T1lg65]|uniref:RAMP superfamily CRISPR-associated protein n=1 Tax=Pseudoalteromonas sp. T1lg65 TaxID=2077101 RepID=UPI003F7A89AF